MIKVAVRKITVNIPVRLLENVKRLTGSSITETIIEALQEIERRENRRALLQLKGKIQFDLDLENSRK